MLLPLTLFLLTPSFPGSGDDGELWDRLSIYANGRLRWESTFHQAMGEDRHRGRMRARLGARLQVAEGLRAEARLSTASDGNDANNPHWDFGDGSNGFNGADLVLDRFYLAWEACECFEVRGGKMPHAFQGPPVYSEFLWDNDVQPGGFAAIYEGAHGDCSWDVRGAAYFAAESGGMDDATMFGGQANVRYALGDGASIGASSAYYDWSHLAPFSGTLGNQGNSSSSVGFGVWDTFLTASVDRWQAFGQYVTNTETGTQDEGFAFGAKWSSGSQKGDFNAFAAYYDFDADAFFSPPAQDDTPIAGTGSGTGMRGVLGGFQYYLAPNVTLKVWVLTSDTDTADPYRLRFDLDFKAR